VKLVAGPTIAYEWRRIANDDKAHYPAWHGDDIFLHYYSVEYASSLKSIPSLLVSRPSPSKNLRKKSSATLSNQQTDRDTDRHT